MFVVYHEFLFFGELGLYLTMHLIIHIASNRWFTKVYSLMDTHFKIHLTTMEVVAASDHCVQTKFPHRLSIISQAKITYRGGCGDNYNSDRKHVLGLDIAELDGMEGGPPSFEPFQGVCNSWLFLPACPTTNLRTH